MNIPVETIAREGSGESADAQVMIARTIITRAIRQSGDACPESLKKACLKKWQYSCWNPGVKQTPRTAEELKTAKKALDIALMTDGTMASHYYDDSISPPYWVDSMEFIVKIGRLNFYYGR